MWVPLLGHAKESVGESLGALIAGDVLGRRHKVLDSVASAGFAVEFMQ